MEQQLNCLGYSLADYLVGREKGRARENLRNKGEVLKLKIPQIKTK
jgi:hypothetical protein